MVVYRIVAHRDFVDYDLLSKYLDSIIIDKNSKIITGGIKGFDGINGINGNNCINGINGINGIDRLIERYCIEKGHILVFYISDWLKYGKRVKMVANREIVFNSDIIIAILTDKYSHFVEMTLCYAANMNKVIHKAFL